MATMTPKAKRCITCREHRPGAAYATSRTRQCTDCAQRVPERPCHRCGEQRPVTAFVWRGYVCSTCREAEKPTEKRCWTCNQTRSVAQFTGSCGRRCIPCKQQALAQATCVICEQPAGLGANGKPRKVCTRPECIEEMRIRNARKAHLVVQERMATRTAKRCPACAIEKPLTEEFWSVKSRDPEVGAAREFDGYCRSCKSADQKDRYRHDPAFRAYALDKAKRARDEENRRRAEDPEYDAMVRARRQGWQRARRGRRIAGAPDRRSQRGRDDAASFPDLPSVPLWQAITQMVEREGLDGGTKEMICERAGIPERRLLSWGPGGEQQSVRFDTADKVISRLDLEWWNVYGPEHGDDVHALAVRVWAGDDVAVAA